MKKFVLSRLCVSMFALGLAAAAPTALAQKPKITSVSKVSALQYQTIVIDGSGFGTQAPYQGNSDYISFADLTDGWLAGSGVDGTSQNGLIVNSWTDSQIVLGGFTSNAPLPKVGDIFGITIWNAQSGAVDSEEYASLRGKVSPLGTRTELVSSTNPSADGEAVTFIATVSSHGATPPDGETVTFMKGSTMIGTATLSGGRATFTTSTLAAGTHVISAEYRGDKIFQKSLSKAVKQVVQP
jgi:hypothetical protein